VSPTLVHEGILEGSSAVLVVRKEDPVSPRVVQNRSDSVLQEANLLSSAECRLDAFHVLKDESGPVIEDFVGADPDALGKEGSTQTWRSQDEAVRIRRDDRCM
jgi:hypothetical protein